MQIIKGFMQLMVLDILALSAIWMLMLGRSSIIEWALVIIVAIKLNILNNMRKYMQNKD